jgi:hypothetical protein
VTEERDQTADDEVPVKAPAKRANRRVLPTGFSTLRDVISFLLGIGIVINEVWLSTTVEAYAIGVGVALMGLPLVFGADERKSK